MLRTVNAPSTLQFVHRKASFWRTSGEAGMSCLAFALLTFMSLRLRVPTETLALVYFVLLVVVSLWSTTLPSMVIAILSALSLNLFFTPGFGPEVRERKDIVDVIGFVTASLVITRLMARLRQSIGDLRALKERAQLAFDAVPSLLWRARPDGSCDFFSLRWLEYTGLSSQQAVGWGWATAIHDDDRPRFVDDWKAALQGGRLLETEVRLRRADGEHRWFLIRARPLTEELGRIRWWFASASDIEDRRQAEAALRQSECALRGHARLLNLTHDTVIVHDIHDVITYWNRGAEDLYGWTREQALGQVAHQLLETVFPAPFEEIVATLTETGRWEGELIHTRRDGTKVVVASRWASQDDQAGCCVGLLETNNDITERRRAEDAVREMQAELAHIARVTTMGEMAASIAHEVNQPLTGVVINGNAALRWLAGNPPNLAEACEAVEYIIQDGKRASEVIARIRSLSKKSGTEKEPVDLNETITEVVAFAHGELLRSRVALRTDLGRDLPRVMGDRVQLQQVVLNLVLNGIEAMSLIVDRPRELLIETKSEDAAHIRVAVKDVGIGFQLENVNRLFDPFYTTKRGGMGMGLSISRSIIEYHGGLLWAVPNEGPGSTFFFTV
jgi:two-component system sensor kinase FixL